MKTQLLSLQAKYQDQLLTLQTDKARLHGCIVMPLWPYATSTLKSPQVARDVQRSINSRTIWLTLTVCLTHLSAPGSSFLAEVAAKAYVLTRKRSAITVLLRNSGISTEEINMEHPHPPINLSNAKLAKWCLSNIPFQNSNTKITRETSKYFQKRSWLMKRLR